MKAEPEYRLMTSEQRAERVVRKFPLLRTAKNKEEIIEAIAWEIESDRHTIAEWKSVTERLHGMAERLDHRAVWKLHGQN